MELKQQVADREVLLVALEVAVEAVVFTVLVELDMGEAMEVAVASVALPPPVEVVYFLLLVQERQAGVGGAHLQTIVLTVEVAMGFRVE